MGFDKGGGSTCTLSTPAPPRNQPDVKEVKTLPNPERWVGAELSLIVEGNMKNYRAKILKYLRQIAVITPYATFRFRCGQNAHSQTLLELRLSFETPAGFAVPVNLVKTSGHSFLSLPAVLTVCTSTYIAYPLIALSSLL